MKTNFRSVSLCLLAMVLASGCGPVPEDMPLTENMKPEASETIDPDAYELASPGTVYAQTFLGDLRSDQGSPVTTYAAISSASNQWSVNCNGGSSRDISYVWKVPATGSYSFSTAGSNFDTVLQIRHFNDTASIFGCNDDYGSGLTSKLTLNSLVKGVNLLIIIEGYAGDYGDYARLNIVKN